MATSGYNREPVPVTDLKAVAEEVIYRAPGKDELEIRKNICAAARDFLTRTGVWKEMRPCVHVQDGWYGFQHGYRHATVLRVDQFKIGMCLQRMEDVVLDGVAPIPCGIPLPLVGNPDAPSVAQFIEQGGYVLVAAPGSSLPSEIPTPYQPECEAIQPVCVGPHQGGEGLAVFTLTLAFGGEVIPAQLIQTYGAIIADGAAHMLLTGPNVARTVYGDRYLNACSTLAMRMSNGGPTATVNGTIFDGTPEV